MEELRIKIIDMINQSGLPLEAIVFVIRDVYRDVNETFKSMQEQKQLINLNKEDNDNGN